MALVVITGSSQGYGRVIALEFAKAFDCDFVLLSRNAPLIRSVKDEIRKSSFVEVVQVDLSDIEAASNVLPEVFAALDLNKYSKLYLINNAASLRVQSLEEIPAIEKAQSMKGFVVNISSLAAIKPFEFMGLYCAEKAARDMLHAVLAKEVEPLGMRVLNYAPGAMETQMQQTLRSVPSPQQDAFVKLHREGKLVDLHVSAAKLLRVLHNEAVPSGAHFDVHDSEPVPPPQTAAAGAQ